MASCAVGIQQIGSSDWNFIQILAVERLLVSCNLRKSASSASAPSWPVDVGLLPFYCSACQLVCLREELGTATEYNHLLGIHSTEGAQLFAFTKLLQKSCPQLQLGFEQIRRASTIGFLCLLFRTCLCACAT